MTKRQQVIEAAPSDDALSQLVEQTLGAKVLEVAPAGKGLIGFVFRVGIDRDPGEVVVKWQKYAGTAVAEQRQLDFLRPYVGSIVPEVIAVHEGSPEQPAEAIVMEALPGVQASSLENPVIKVQEQIAEEAVDYLLKWHSVGNPDGYGPLDGPFSATWSEHMLAHCKTVVADVLVDYCAESLPPGLLDVADRSMEAIGDILGSVQGSAVLLHGDFWLPNILIDPKTYRITGIVDPMGSRWDEREMDVVPMDWPWGDYQFLMNAYQRRHPMREGWPLRYAFHRYWFMMQAIFVLGPGHAAGEAKTLAKAMDEHLGVG